MISVMRKRALSGERWREIIAKQPASGLSIAAFCRQRGVAEASFFAWRRRLRERGTPCRPGEGFAEVKISPEPAMEPVPESSRIEIRLSNGRCVLVRAGFDRQTLLELLVTLEPGAGESAMGAARRRRTRDEAGR
jgi:transposase-like protein